MSPRPTPEQLSALQARLAQASTDRDQRKTEAIEAIETQFWTAIAAEINGDDSYFGIQKDIADALGVTRETIRTQLKKYAPPA
ncbi:hypothetical protein [Streptacidiphilus sp. EB129]|uniref:hypothetical protein n=1 Tax=Streptacidiphilus sp. EB129 TaxID=3156262 RepID=UPI003519248B